MRQFPLVSENRGPQYRTQNTIILILEIAIHVLSRTGHRGFIGLGHRTELIEGLDEQEAPA